MRKGKTIGMDLGDKKHQICILDGKGKVIERKSLVNERERVEEFLKSHGKAMVVMEAGVHSGWIRDLGKDLGVEMLVGNPRELASIWKSRNKNDERDAEQLARLARADEKLIKPVEHRSREARLDLGYLKAREALVRCRGRLINTVRSMVKNFGYRLPSAGAEAFARRVKLPEEMKELLNPLVEQIGELSQRIKGYEQRVEALSEKYPETQLLRQVAGVGPLTATAYVLSVEDPLRFSKSRDAGAYFGLKPRRDQSGETDKQLPISKVGHEMGRRLLVNAAQYVLGRFGPECDLKRFGMKLCARGGKGAKKRAVIAVARKLAVLLHQLWKSGKKYEPNLQLQNA